MNFKRVLLILVMSPFILFALLYLHYDVFRPVDFSFKRFDNNVYEKDFFDRSFVMLFDFPDYWYVKTVDLNLDGRKVPVKIQANFSVEHGWASSICHRASFSISGIENVAAAKRYLVASLGQPSIYKGIQTDFLGNTFRIEHVYWKLGDSELGISGHEYKNETDSLYISKIFKRPSSLFWVYVISKKWFLSKLPESLKPKWFKSFELVSRF